MGGYRNFSRVVMDAGKPDIPSSKTCDLGFNWLVEKVMASTGHSDKEHVTRELIKGFSGEQADHEIQVNGEQLLPEISRSG